MCNRVCALSVLLLSFVLAARCQEARENDVEAEPTFTGRRLMDCLDEGDFKCVKLKVLSNLDKILRMRSFKLMDGVLIEKVNGAEAAEDNSEEEVIDSRYLKNEDEHLDVMIISKLARLFKDRSLKLDVLPGILTTRLARSHSSDGLVDVSVERGSGGGFGGLGGKKGGGGIIILGIMYKLGLIGLALIAVKVLAFKALLVGKISLLLSVINGLKQLMSHGQGHQEYSHIGGYGYSSGRSLGDVGDDAQELAYRGQRQQQMDDV